ncbi:sulfate transporter [Rhipicephalus sanguineus]|uniref:sulfate transporter n=1 Tax=Rhipicephalus sanguineus TaxID=34632 RepID=UPI0020C39D2A|nr:sulfate transporter [Rhipicephalus sanguineus]
MTRIQECLHTAAVLALPGDTRITVDRKALTTDAVASPEPDKKEDASLCIGETCKRALVGAPSFFLGLFPCIAWVRSYKLRTFIVPDFLAGLSVAVLHVPQGLVSAIIAGVDPVLGLYSSLYPAVIYAIVGSSPYVSMGMFPVTALMTGVVVQKYKINSENGTAAIDSGDQLYNEQSSTGVAITLTFLTGLIQVAMWLFQVDRVAAVISPVMAEGFLTGCAVMVIVSQLPSVFGSGAKTSKDLFGTPLTIYYVAISIPYSSLATSLLSLVAFLVLIVSKGVIARQMRRFTAVPLPSDLILVIIATAVSHFLQLDTKHNVKVVGNITSGYSVKLVTQRPADRNRDDVKHSRKLYAQWLQSDGPQQAALANSMHSIKHLPACSPFFNPIEEVFSKFKSHVKAYLSERPDLVLATPQGMTKKEHRRSLLLDAARHSMQQIQFPKPTPPPFDHWVSLIPDAAAISIVQFVSAFSIAKLFGRKQRLKADASQEMLAYGLSSIVGSFFMCIPTGSALARSVVLKDVGAKTQLPGLVSCAFIAVTLYVFAPVFRPLPECVLGVVIIVVLLPMLIKLKHLRMLWFISRFDFALWSLSFLSVVVLNASYGLLVGILLGLVVIFLELSG